MAPFKPVLIPRLELQATLLLARLITSIRNVRLLSHIQYQCWNDASIVLTWLSQHASRCKTFVANRVAEVLSLVTQGQWRHVSTDSNPADLLSGGQSVNELIDCELWWHGPIWLSKSENHWPTNVIDEQVLENLEAKSQVYVTHTNVRIFEDLDYFFIRCSKWAKIVRSLAYVYKFFEILKAKIKNLLRCG